MTLLELFDYFEECIYTSCESKGISVTFDRAYRETKLEILQNYDLIEKKKVYGSL